MDTRSQLLRAIFDQPAEDTPRLLYADWLAENGAPDWGEFIRVQIELTKCHPSCGAGKVCRGVDSPYGITCGAVRDRERELWRQLPTAKVFAPWAKGIATNTDEPRFWIVNRGGPGCVVRRGWVESVACRLDTLFGGECERCTGTGVVGGYYGDNISTPVDYEEHDCHACLGTSRTPGIAADLFACHPVERVTLTDREPWAGNWSHTDRRGAPDVFGWWCSEHMGNEASNLPMAVLDRMADDPRRLKTPQDYYPNNGGHGCVMFAHNETAVDAASRACVGLGRSLAAGWTHEGPCPTCERKERFRRCRRCGVTYRAIHKYSDCDSPGCDGERSDDAPCPDCRGTGTATRPGLGPLTHTEVK